jgi:hypothetical protein
LTAIGLRANINSRSAHFFLIRKRWVVETRQQDGPSRRLVAWRRFVLETVLCVVLIGAVGVIGLHASNNALAGIALGGAVTAILRILWRDS